MLFAISHMQVTSASVSLCPILLSSAVVYIQYTSLQLNSIASKIDRSVFDIYYGTGS